MIEIIIREASTVELKELVGKFIPDSIAKQIEKECKRIFPITNVFLRKVKVLKTPRFDATKFLELHEETKSDTGAPVDRPAEAPAPTPAAAPAQ
jgi:small subunit ribosomal protein S3Ae